MTTPERRGQPRTAADALITVSRTGRALRHVAAVAAVYLAVVVTIASVVGVVNAVRAVDYARQAAVQAKANGDVAGLIRSCVEATPPGTEPTECVRNGDARTGEAVAAIVDSDGNGVLDAIEVREALRRIERVIDGERS